MCCWGVIFECFARGVLQYSRKSVFNREEGLQGGKKERKGQTIRGKREKKRGKLDQKERKREKQRKKKEENERAAEIAAARASMREKKIPKGSEIYRKEVPRASWIV